MLQDPPPRPVGTNSGCHHEIIFRGSSTMKKRFETAAVLFTRQADISYGNQTEWHGLYCSKAERTRTHRKRGERVHNTCWAGRIDRGYSSTGVVVYSCRQEFGGGNGCGCVFSGVGVRITVKRLPGDDYSKRYRMLKKCIRCLGTT